MAAPSAAGRIGPARRPVLFPEERLELGGQVVAAGQHLLGLVGLGLQSLDVLGDLGIDVDGGFDMSLPLGGRTVEVRIAGLDPRDLLEASQQGAGRLRVGRVRHVVGD